MRWWGDNVEHQQQQMMLGVLLVLLPPSHSSGPAMTPTLSLCSISNIIKIIIDTTHNNLNNLNQQQYSSIRLLILGAKEFIIHWFLYSNALELLLTIYGSVNDFFGCEKMIEKEKHRR